MLKKVLNSMGLKSHIKLFKTFFTQVNETHTQQVLGVEGSSITAYTGSGYLRFSNIETGLLDGYYLLSQLETLANLIGDDTCVASESDVKYGKVKLKLCSLSNYMVPDYSSLDQIPTIHQELVRVIDFESDLKEVLPFTDSKSHTSACVVYNNFLYAHNGIVVIKKTTGCGLKFQPTPAVWKIIGNYLSHQKATKTESINIEIKEHSIQISSDVSTILLPLMDTAEATATQMESLFSQAEGFDSSFEFDLVNVVEGLVALDLLQDLETKVLVVENADSDLYTIKSVCETVKLENLERTNKLFNFSARAVWLKLCLKNIRESSFQVQPCFDSERGYTTMMLFSDFANDCKILMSCVIT